MAQKGSIIVFSVLITAIIVTASFYIIGVIIPRIRLVREVSNSVSAIYAADSIIEWCFYEFRHGVTPLPNMLNNATYNITPPGCPSGVSLNHTAVGTFRGVSRAFEVEAVVN